MPMMRCSAPPIDGTGTPLDAARHADTDAAKIISLLYYVSHAALFRRAPIFAISFTLLDCDYRFHI